MRKFYVIIICIILMNLIFYFPKYVFAAESTFTAIGLVEECAYSSKIKRYYIAVTTKKNPYCILVGDNNKNIYSNIKQGDVCKVSYSNIRYHKEGNHVRCFGMITNIMKIDKEKYKKEISKIKPLQRSSGYFYLSELRNPSLIKMYLNVLNRK